MDPGQKITISDLKTVILALQSNHLSRLNALKSDLGLSLRSQQNRIRYLERKVSYQQKLINILRNRKSVKSRQTQPENSQQPHVNNAIKNVDALKSTEDNPLDMKYMQKEKYSKAMPGRPERARKERLLIQEIPTSSAVVAFYAYMSTNLPANVATPHHVLIFDVVKTNIGNAYHSSTGVFMVPETGVYVFIWSFMNGASAYHSTQLMVNTEEWGIVHAHSGPTSYMQSTGVVVVHVNKGDDVFVKTSDSSNGILNSNLFSKTLFAGWKLH